MRRLFVVLLAMVVSTCLSGQIVVTEAGEAKARIVVASEDENNQKAALLLQDFINRSSGALLPIAQGKKAKSGDIVIGVEPPASVTEDGYSLMSRDGVLYISGVEKGVIYGVVSLLERELNADYFTANVYNLDKRSSISFSEVDTISNPTFRYRQTQCYAQEQDPIYRIWMRLEEPREIFAGGLWVHTFNRILSSDEYGDSHPEYFSFIKGQRRPGHASQWCLTNDELFEIVAHRVDSIFKAHPKQRMLSISQNDSNFTYCQCEECQKINEYEEQPSGAYVRFLNRLAERFPDKEFSTLAYLFTMKPPKHVKPLPNVNIMLCNINCFREVPLTDNATGKIFTKAIEQWNEISDNIFVWDYGINFDNVISPFPNFPILKPNIDLFKRNDVTMHFSQISGLYGGDFSEMRAYVVSKLMWDHTLSADSLVRHFTDNYYGAAGRYIYDYEKLLEGALLSSDIGLWINDSPVSHATGMLNEKCCKRYNELFDMAEKAVESDPVLLKRVRMARLSVIYSELEIARTRLDGDAEVIAQKLDLFENYTREYGIERVNNHGNLTTEYCQIYRERYIPTNERSLALGSSIKWEVVPDGKYAATGERYLTDGLFGGATFKDSWCGWEGKDAAFVIDMGSEKEFTTIESDFLCQLKGWVLLPKGVSYSISSDGENFTEFGKVALAEDRDVSVHYVQATHKSISPASARYIRVEVEGTKECPAWHFGVGYPCWFFIDEVTVK